MNLLASVESIVTRLEAGGVRAVLDVRDVNPPCALVRPPTIGYRFGGCNALTFEVRAVGLDTGVRNALDVLGPLVDAIQAAMGQAAATATPGDMILPDGGHAPIYTLTYVTTPV